VTEKLLKSVFSFSSMTFISRILGLVRDIVFARYFGAGMATDAFFVAFKIPNFMRRLFAEGAFSQGFIPVLSEYKVQRPHEEVQTLVSKVMGTLGLVLLILTGAGVLILPPLFDWIGTGWFEGEEQQKFLLAGDLIRWTFPYIFFISLTALVSGVLNTYRLFALPAFTPVLLNIVLIGATIGFSPLFDEPVTAIAIGVFVAGVVQLLFLLPALYRLRLLVVPVWGWIHEGVNRISRLMVPAIFGASVVQINLMIDTAIAFLLVSGSVSWLYYSDRLVEFPLGIFGIALSTVLLPGLSGRVA
jgi:putative peptidoglycan lipid II flippase